jgi:hypothetical protein
MKGTDDLIAKWAEQKSSLQAEADGMPPGADRDAVLRRICQTLTDGDRSSRTIAPGDGRRWRPRPAPANLVSAITQSDEVPTGRNASEWGAARCVIGG